ncbi:RNase H-like domain found in reverse transcriptase [Popillia japonica]|uniref:RNase H-like domain found in reverse transcriptase n=1 Tax=Popillia japonica TaxID=7064 RepID=A0AAW1LVD7_POPJA
MEVHAFYNVSCSTIDKGIAPDPKKVEAINNLDPPKNPSEDRSLLGMFNYVGKFIPNLASKTQPFRNLITKDCKWNWTTKHQNIFDGLKKQLSEAPNLVYYDATKVIHLYVDAGPQGLGAILIQEKNGVTETVAYGSRSLTATEGRYSQIEKEMLAITWAMKHFHIYLFGVNFCLHTDHKPLVSILQNPKSNPSARIERLRLRIQAYTFITHHQKGSSNPADYISRHPTQHTVYEQAKAQAVEEQLLNLLQRTASPKQYL